MAKLDEAKQELDSARFLNLAARLEFLTEQAKATNFAVSALSNMLDEVLKELDKVRKG